MKPKKDQMIELRNELLADSDWTQGADSPLDADTKAAWATYRQALRDITEAEGFPEIAMPNDPVMAAVIAANEASAGE